MPEPKSGGFESWVERQIRKAAEKGAFDNLPGSGKPLPGLGKPYDENWWVKRKLRSENLSYLPPSLALRKEIHDALEGTSRAATEDEVRALVSGINEKIREANRLGLRGPAVNLPPFNVERVVREWRQGRQR